ncbi:ribbon-helix-helix protein, CopG family [Pseudomonas taetrolens]|uniref:ribbon-helix-helix protein, CopG family n=1 Tax=Pseudomonas taetrolens TaxID=47884 RepID=UPI0030D8B43C
MPDNARRLTILIDPETKKKLEELARKSDLTVSQILRKLLKNHLKDFAAPADKPDASGR